MVSGSKPGTMTAVSPTLRSTSHRRMHVLPRTCACVLWGLCPSVNDLRMAARWRTVGYQLHQGMGWQKRAARGVLTVGSVSPHSHWRIVTRLGMWRGCTATGRQLPHTLIHRTLWLSVEALVQQPPRCSNRHSHSSTMNEG